MAEMGTLVVRMAAESAQLRTELDRVQQQLKGTSTATDLVSRNFRALSGLAAGFSLVAIVQQSLAAAEALQNAAAKTGITTDALQRMQFVASLSGGSLEQMTSAVAKVQKALVTSGEGSAEATRALDRLGISTSQYLSLAPDKQFEAVAVAIAGIEDPAARTVAAIDLFGRSGAELLPTLIAMGDASGALTEQFAAIGGPVSAEAISKVDALGDQFDTLGLGAKNLGVEVAALVAVPMTALLGSLNELVGAARMLAGGGGELERLENKLRILRDEYNTLPIFFNFGYVEGEGVVMGPEAIRRAMTDIERQIQRMKDESAFTPVMENPEIALDAPNFRFGPSEAEIRAATDAQRAFNRELQATLEYNDQQLRQFVDEDLALVTRHEVNTAIENEFDAMMGERMTQRLLDEAAYQSERQRLAEESSNFLIDLIGAQTQMETDIRMAGAMAWGEITAMGLGMVAGSNEKVAKLVQGMELAKAIWFTASGVTNALSSVPFPANIAAAAKVAAMGAIQIAKIKATRYSAGSVSGGSVSIGGGGGEGAGRGAVPNDVPGIEQQQPQRMAQVVIQGNVFSSRETADWIIGQLQDAINDRDVVFINGNSRQAGLITEGA